MPNLRQMGYKAAHEVLQANDKISLQGFKEVGENAAIRMATTLKGQGSFMAGWLARYNRDMYLRMKADTRAKLREELALKHKENGSPVPKDLHYYLDTHIVPQVGPLDLGKHRMIAYVRTLLTYLPVKTILHVLWDTRAAGMMNDDQAWVAGELFKGYPESMVFEKKEKKSGKQV